MKTFIANAVLFLFTGCWCASAALAGEPSARISGVHLERATLVVDVEASGALGKITLESSTRLGRRAWEPRAVYIVPATNSGPLSLAFEIPISPDIEILRVRADYASSTLPAAFYNGTNSFVAGGGNTAGGTTGTGTGGTTGSTIPVATDQNGAPADNSRTVTESDIWKLDGDTLYFFNQNRGLQVIDVSNPAVPVVTGTYTLPASGEQMYVQDHTNIVLLARDNCGWFGSGNDSRVILLNILNGVPSLVKELPVSGYITESRMVGTALYLASSSYQARPAPARDGAAAGTEWVWGSEVVSFDLSNFASAAQKSDDWVEGYGNVIYATDQYLFVAQNNYEYQNNTTSALIRYYDISSPDGTFAKRGVIKLAGAIRDKFKMGLNGDTFSAVSQIDWPAPRLTYVNTFSLADPANPVQLGRMKVVESEQLYATRFDGSRLYVVTYFQIDPLWIIDLSNPAQPKKIGELQIPGWSTYLQPMGDKLLAIGMDRDTNSTRTAVQLFDVSNAAQPALLSKVVIGDQWSSSEANWDEKAFGVFPEDNLILVPFNASSASGYIQGVQIVDFKTSGLIRRGVITQDIGSRRAAIHRGVILSISNSDLLSVDAADRDNPKVIARTELSWPVDRVHLSGNYLVEVDAYRAGHPELRIVSTENPENVLSITALTNLDFLGSAELNGNLYVLQGRPAQVIYPAVYNPTNYFPISTNPGVLLVSRFDLSALPELRLTAQAAREGVTNYFYGQYDALQVTPGLLVWRSKYSYYPVYLDTMTGAVGGTAAAPLTPGASLVIGRPIPIWGGGGGHFIAVSIANGNPVISSEFQLLAGNGWWGFGDSFAAGSLLYTSHEANDWDTSIDPPPYTYNCFDATGTNIVTCTNDPPPGVWVTRYYLDVIDYSDPADPLVRKPVNIPGALSGIDTSGQLLFTRGPRLETNLVWNGDEQLSASAYDGVEAHLITSLAMPNQWPRPSLFNRGYFYLGNAASYDDTNATLQTWALNTSGKFEMIEEQHLPYPAQTLALSGGLLVLQSSQGNELGLYDPADPAHPVPAGGGRLNMCIGFNIQAADGDRQSGLWVPASWYGVSLVPVKKP